VKPAPGAAPRWGHKWGQVGANWSRGGPLGLRVQILVGLGFVTGFAMLSTGYLALWAAGQSVVGQRETAARSIAAGLGAAVAATVDPMRALGDDVNRARLRSILGALEGRGELTGIDVLGPDRKVILARPPRAPGDVDPPTLAVVLSGVGPWLTYRPDRSGAGTELCAYAPVVAAGRVLGVVRIVQPAPDPLATVLSTSGSVLLALAFADALLVVGLGFFVLTRLVVRPLQGMQLATARVSSGDWDHQIETEGPREVAALASALNQMTASLASQREQLIRTEKLASVGQLAAGVAHEIGNPLAAVLGYVDILRGDAAAGSVPVLGPEETRDTLDRVKAETQRIHRIIQDLLAYSRPTTEDPQATAPGKILRSAEALLRPQGRFRAVAIVARPDDATWPAVLASPGRLTQVFVNLLLNASDAMGGKGTVTVVCQAIDDQIRIEFHDQGPGIPAELERKIFDPFFTTKDPGQGTGLGLSISQSIIAAFHGTLTLMPAAPAGTGATFVITLPAAGSGV
jgi:two-component system NtrC family sensor kinase